MSKAFGQYKHLSDILVITDDKSWVWMFLHANKKLFAKIHQIVIKEMHRYYSDKAKLAGIKDPRPGSISFTQRWGSALNPILTTREPVNLCTS